MKTDLLKRLPALCALAALAVLPVPAAQAHDGGSARPADTVRLQRFGLRPGTGEDATAALRAAVEEIRQRRRPAVLLFEPGRYDFYAPDGRDDTVNVVATLRGIDSLTVDGSGATFIGHGRLSLFSAEECRRLTIRNFALDWQRPYITQAVVVDIAGDRVEMAIDRTLYPYAVEEGRIRFLGENWRREVDPESYSTAYDPIGGGVLYGTRDAPLSADNSLFRGEACEIADGIVRFTGRVDRQVAAGTPVALYHGRYLTVAISLWKCSDVVFEEVELRHSPGCGIVGVKCENVRLARTRTAVDRSRGRYFSCAADAFHFNTCRGLIELDGCACDGQGDDALNVHGTYLAIDSVSDDRLTIRLRALRGDTPLFVERGDRLWPISAATVSRGAAVGVVQSYPLDGGALLARLDAPLPETIRKGDYAENASWCPDVHVHDCSFGRANRARGILLTTPGRVTVERNRFATAGTAILVEGDLSYWYESGAVRDMEIRDNLFENCGTSATNDGGFGWGEAVISITPSHRPATEEEPAYHRNIRIRDNRILTYDRPLLHACSVEGLEFVGNRIEQTDAYPATARQRETFLLEGCRKVTIRDNTCIGYENPETKLLLAKPEELTTDLP